MRTMAVKFFKPLGIGGATALIAVTSFASYALGLLRDRIIAVHFGTSTATDTYNASFLIPDSLFNLFIAGALAAAFMPIFSEYLAKDKKEAFKVANIMLTIFTLTIGVLAVIAFIFMKPIIAFSFPEANELMKTDIVNMTRVMLSSAIVFTISNTLGNILMSYKHFFSYALSPILYNLGIILGVVFLQEKLGIYAASIGVLIGGILHCLIRIIDTLATEYRYKPEFQVSHPGFKKIIRLMIPRTVSQLAMQFNLYLFTIVGIRIVEGGVAAFNFARNIQSFAVSIFGISFATAVFPYLASAISSGDRISYTEHIQKTMQRILFFTIPSMVGMMLLAKPVVEMILSGGEFDKESVRLTSLILFFFAISIPFESLSHILSRGFYAIKNTLTPMYIYFVSMVIIAFSTLYLAPKYGIEWFSIGFSLGFIFFVIINLILLKKHFEKFNFKMFIASLSKTIIASGIMAIVVMLCEPLREIINPKLADLMRIIIGAGAFFLTAFLLKSSEVSNVNYILAKLFKKPVNETKI